MLAVLVLVAYVATALRSGDAAPPRTSVEGKDTFARTLSNDLIQAANAELEKSMAVTPAKMRTPTRLRNHAMRRTISPPSPRRP